ncbi:hypothetical protein [Teichococcus aestuarii]|uniref:hypothetical protein n=1 Tax=Teichococcus aestuarii TaxID=568898 RepID=UPI003611445C
MPLAPRRALLAAPALLLPALRPGAARSQPAWPSRPIRLIVPFAAGGAADSAARTIAPAWASAWARPSWWRTAPARAAASAAAWWRRRRPTGTCCCGTPPPTS